MYSKRGNFQTTAIFVMKAEAVHGLLANFSPAEDEGSRMTWPALVGRHLRVDKRTDSSGTERNESQLLNSFCVHVLPLHRTTRPAVSAASAVSVVSVVSAKQERTAVARFSTSTPSCFVRILVYINHLSTARIDPHPLQRPLISALILPKLPPSESTTFVFN